MNKRKFIFSMLLSLILIFNCSASFAMSVPSRITLNRDKSGDLQLTINTEDMSIEEIEKQTEEQFEKLGISKGVLDAVNKVRRENAKNGAKLVKQEISINNDFSRNQYSLNDVKSSRGTTYVGKYKGYPMRYVKVKDHQIWGSTDLLDVTNDDVVKTLDTSFNIAIGFLSAWVWVPATIFGFTASDIGKMANNIDDRRRPHLYAALSEQLTYKYYEIEDLDDQVEDYDWYCYGITNKTNVTVNLTLDAYDKNHDKIEPDTGKVKKTFYAKNYNSDSQMMKKVYEAYKNDMYNGLYNESIHCDDAEDVIKVHRR